MSTADHVIRVAALDPRLADAPYLMVARALRGLDPITGEKVTAAVTPVRTPVMPTETVDLAAIHNSVHQEWQDKGLRVTGCEFPDVDGASVYIGGAGAYRHAELPKLIALLTAIYHASSDSPEEEL